MGSSGRGPTGDVLRRSQDVRAWIPLGGPGVWVLAGLTAVIDAAASIIRHVRGESGLDLAIFDQAVWHYSRLEAPFSSIEGKNLLGDHFHPLVALLAPLYWLWSDPRMLLIAQSALIAASIIPVFLFARSHLGPTGGYLLAGAYAAFWGVQVGVLYEFHELAFAPLLIALSILLADRGRWGWFWLVIILLLGVKEDLSIFVVFFGIYLLSRRELRHGVALMAAGIAWYTLATGVLLPHFAGGGGYSHWTYGELGHNLGEAGWALLHAPWRLFTIAFSPAQKTHTMAGLLAPFLFLSLGSRVFLLAVPLLAERFLSTNPAFWSSHFHYSLALAPVLAMGAARGLSNLLPLLAETRRRKVVVAGTGAMLVTSFAITRLVAADSALSQATRPSFYTTPGRTAGLYRALSQVPATASLAGPDFVLPHASQRPRLELIGPAAIGLDEYLLVNVIDSTCCGDTGNQTYVGLGQVLDVELARMTPVYYDTGWLVARRPEHGAPPSNGGLAPMSLATAPGVDLIGALWRRELAATSGRFSVCEQPSLVRAGSAAGCFASANARFQGVESRLSSALHGELPTLRGGCADLARAALSATQWLAADQSLIARAARATDRGRLASAMAAAEGHENDRDLTGQLDRFLILCTPRGQPR